MSTKSAKIAAQIADLEAAMAEAQAREREVMRARVMRVAEKSGLLDIMLSSKQLAAAFSTIVANPPAEPNKQKEQSHGYDQN